MKTTSKEIPKIIYRRCAQCSTPTNSKLLYTVMDRKVCLSCGNEELRKWNEWVKEADAPPT